MQSFDLTQHNICRRRREISHFIQSRTFGTTTTTEKGVSQGFCANLSPVVQHLCPISLQLVHLKFCVTRVQQQEGDVIDTIEQVEK